MSAILSADDLNDFMYVGNAPGRGSARNFREKYVDDDFGDTSGHGTFVAGMAEGENSDYAELMRESRLERLRHQHAWEDSNLPVSMAAVADAIKAGIQVITSAGNEGKDGGTVPCGYLGVVCVGGVTKQYEKQRTSHYGTGVTLYAPSERLRGPGHDADDSWVWKSGTSMAAPAVAGVASIFISYENIRDKAGTVRERILQNAHKDVLIDKPDNSPIPNVLVHTGLEHPDRKPYWPYVGPSPDQEVPEHGVDNDNGNYGSIDGSNLPDFGAPDGPEPADVPDSDELYIPAFRFEPLAETKSTI